MSDRGDGARPDRVPYPSRPHTHEELQAMEQQVSAAKRPVINDLRAYRAHTAREGRLMATLTPTPGAGNAKKRSLSAPHGGGGKRSRTPSPPPMFSYHVDRTGADKPRPTKVMPSEVFPPNPDGVQVPIASKTYSAFAGPNGGRSLPPPWLERPVAGRARTGGGGAPPFSAGARGDLSPRAPSGSRRKVARAAARKPSRAARQAFPSAHSQPPPAGHRRGYGPAVMAALTSPVPTAATQTPYRSPRGELPPGSGATTTAEGDTSAVVEDAEASGRERHHAPSKPARDTKSPKASPKMRPQKDAFQRSRSAPSRVTGRGAAPPPSSTTHLRGAMPKDRAGVVRTIAELVAELASTDKTHGPARVRGQVAQSPIDNGWHIVVADLERQVANAKAQQRAMAAAHEQEKAQWRRESEGALIAQMADIESFYEERLSEWRQEVRHVEHMNAELRRETVELRKMFQHQEGQQAADHCTGLIAEDGSVRRRDAESASTATICLVTARGASPRRGGGASPNNTSLNTSTAPPPSHAQSPSAADNASELVPVHLSLHPGRVPDPPVALTQPASVPRSQAGMATTPPPTAPSPISPYAANSPGSDDGSARRYLDLMDKNTLAQHLLSAKLELDYERRKSATSTSECHPDDLYGPSWSRKKKMW